MLSVEIKKLPESVVEIKGEIPADQFEQHRPKAIKNIGENAEIPGFRKGKAPENILLQKFGEEKILYEMAELALDDAFPKILESHNVDALGRPSVSITKIARGNPLGFSITVAVMPEFTLPDYKHIAKKTNEEREPVGEVEEKEIVEAIENIRKQVSLKENSAKDGGAPELPEFNDEFVKKLGDYNNTADFKEKLKNHLQEEKNLRAREKQRIKIMDAIFKEISIELPRVIIEGELDKMATQFKGDISRMGVSFEDYLKHSKKTEEAIRKEWENDAKKRATLELVLQKISQKEHIVPTEEEVLLEVGHLIKHHKDVDLDRARLYMHGILVNEKVLRFLEEQK